jgi:hypothetical protein
MTNTNINDLICNITSSSIAKASTLDLPTNILVASENQTTSGTSDLIFNIASSSIAKASMLDLPTNILFSSTPIFSSTMSATTYGIRSSINAGINEYFELTPEDFYANQLRAITSGATGGYFKYYVTGQNPIIGALNNAAYELCNNFESCGNDPVNNALFTIAVESADAVAQTYLNTLTGNVPGALCSAAIGGAKVGAAISYFANMIYVPLMFPEEPILAGIDTMNHTSTDEL